MFWFFSRCCALGLGVRLPALYILVTKQALLRTLCFVFSDCGREEVEGGLMEVMDHFCGQPKSGLLKRPVS